MTAIWNASAVTPLATDRIPVDVSSSGAPSRWTGQNVADINTIIGGTVTALGSIGTNTALNLALGGYFSATITGNLTFSITNVPASAGVTFVLALTNGGAFTVTLPGSVTIIGGSPALSAAGTDWLVFRTLDGGTAWTLEVVGNPRDADLATWATITPGTGVGTALAVNVGTAGAVVTNGGALGTPSSGNLANCTGYPVGGSSGQLVYNDAGTAAGSPLWREDANTVAQRNGTTVQALYLYKTTDGGSNYARLRFSMGVDDSMSLQIFGQKSGTGAYTNVDIGFSNTQLLRQDGTNATLFGQNFKPFEDNTYDIGSSSAGWRTGYFDTSVITPTLTNAGTAVVAATRLRADGFGTALSSKSADYTAVATDSTLLVDATAAARTITLPAASGATGRIYVVKKTDAGGNSVTVDANASGTIDGATTYVLATQYKFVAIQCDGSNWHVIGAN